MLAAIAYRTARIETQEAVAKFGLDVVAITSDALNGPDQCRIHQNTELPCHWCATARAERWGVDIDVTFNPTDPF